MTTPEERVEGVHDPRHDGDHRSRRPEDRRRTRASSELKMHLEVYRNRPDARAVVHAHPPTATGFAVAGIPLDRAVLAEVITTLGSIPIAEYATPRPRSCRRRAASTSRRTTGCCSPITARWRSAGDVFTAYYRMETIEHFATISLVARHARPREPAVARRGRSAPGAARDVRHRVAGADLHRRDDGWRPETASWIARWCRRRDAGRRAAGARYAACRRGDRHGRGNSANIPRTDGADRGRRRNLK